MEARLRSWWQKIKQHRVTIGVVVIVLLVVITLIIAGYWFDWTGFNGYNKVTIVHTISGTNAGTFTKTEEYQSGKALWDWLQLLIIPVALAIGGYLFTRAQKEKEKRDELHDLHRRFYANVFQAFHDAKRVRRLLRATAQYLPPDQKETMILLEPYDKQMQALVDIQLQFETFEDDVEQNSTFFPDDQPNDQMRNVLKIYFHIIQNYLHAIVKEYENHYQKLTPSDTKTKLPITDLEELKKFIDKESKHNKFFKLGRRVRKVLRDQLKSEISSLKGAIKPVSEIVCNLSEVDLSGDDLRKADLRKADLSNAILFNADLSNADLEGANLNKSWVTKEQLAKAKSLQGAIMPDGKIHP